MQGELVGLLQVEHHEWRWEGGFFILMLLALGISVEKLVAVEMLSDYMADLRFHSVLHF